MLFKISKLMIIAGTKNNTPTIELAQKDKQNGQLIKYSSLELLYFTSMYPRTASKISESITT